MSTTARNLEDPSRLVLSLFGTLQTLDNESFSTFNLLGAWGAEVPAAD